jgi:hypothetical protein
VQLKGKGGAYMCGWSVLVSWPKLATLAGLGRAPHRGSELGRGEIDAHEGFEPRA